MYGSRFDGDGDFDQLSITGVDFGADYTKDYGIEPNNLTSEEVMEDYSDGSQEYYGDDSQQLGDESNADFGMSAFGAFPKNNGMGLIPSGLGYDANQLGLIPSGLGYDPNQLGSFVPATMSGLSDTLKTPLFKVGNFQVTYMHAALALAAGAVAYKMGYLKKLGFNF